MPFTSLVLFYHYSPNSLFSLCLYFMHFLTTFYDICFLATGYNPDFFLSWQDVCSAFLCYFKIQHSIIWYVQHNSNDARNAIVFLLKYCWRRVVYYIMILPPSVGFDQQKNKRFWCTLAFRQFARCWLRRKTNKDLTWLSRFWCDQNLNQMLTRVTRLTKFVHLSWSTRQLTSINNVAYSQWFWWYLFKARSGHYK